MFYSLKADYDALVNVRLTKLNQICVSGVDQENVHSILDEFADFVDKHPGWTIGEGSTVVSGTPYFINIYIKDGSSPLDVGDAIASEFEQAGLKVRRLLTQQHSEKIVPTFAEA